MSKTTKTTRATIFTNLLRDYERATRDYLQRPCTETERERTETAKTLATACTFAVLKKLETASGNKTIADLRRDLARDLNNADRLETISDASDLLQTALLAIFDETAKTADTSADFMERPYTVRRLKRKVWIKTAESKDGWETVETTAIQEVYKAIRREIESNRSMQTASNKYCYIADLATDEESGDEETIYRRLPKYSGLAEETTDYNGKVTAITADKESAETANSLVESLNLSKQQMTILQYRMSGYGYKAIATALGVRSANIQTQCKRIAEKVTASGLFSAELLAKYAKTAD